MVGRSSQISVVGLVSLLKEESQLACPNDQYDLIIYNPHTQQIHSSR